MGKKPYPKTQYPLTRLNEKERLLADKRKDPVYPSEPAAGCVDG
jgi:hypothetical protein